MSAFVEDQESPLTITLTAKPIEVQVEPAAKVFEGQFHRILIWIREFVDSACERSCAVVGVAQDCEDRPDYACRLVAAHPSPWFCAPAEDFGRVEFHAVRIVRMNRLSKLVELLRNPMSLGLEDGDTRENEVLFVGVARRSRVVEVEEVHERKKAAEGLFVARTAKAALPTARRYFPKSRKIVKCPMGALGVSGESALRALMSDSASGRRRAPTVEALAAGAPVAQQGVRVPCEIYEAEPRAPR